MHLEKAILLNYKIRKDLGEIQTNIRVIQTKNSFCFGLDCRPKKFKTDEIQTKTAESTQNPGNQIIKGRYRISM
jgi:hypothetical protein